jgi:hypothetical protein
VQWIHGGPGCSRHLSRPCNACTGCCATAPPAGSGLHSRITVTLAATVQALRYPLHPSTTVRYELDDGRPRVTHGVNVKVNVEKKKRALLRGHGRAGGERSGEVPGLQAHPHGGRFETPTSETDASSARSRETTVDGTITTCARAGWWPASI